MIQKMQRTKQSVKNAAFSIGAQLIQQLIKLLVRIAFIRVIGEYLGVNGLFTDILTTLQLVELGIGPAIAYSLYKPLANNDTNKVKALMNLFRKAYRAIGTFILIAGVAFTPFYGFFINEMPENIPNLNIIYWIFVFDTGISYFYSYYRTLLVSDQKKYLDISIQTGVTVCISIIQIVLIYVTRNYMWYLGAQIVGTILTNFIASRIAMKQYPYLKEKEVEKLDDETFGEIKKNVVAMVFHKVGSIIRDATDNLLISKYIGLVMTGIYSNYLMITKALTTLINQIFSAVVSSVGNLHVTRSEEAQQEVFYNINFLNFWIASFCTCCFGALIGPFILVISNENYLMSEFITILISIRLYLDMMRKTPWMFCEAAGIYWNGKTKPLWEVAVNLVVSLILVKTIGIAGVFIGTIVTILVVDLPVEPHLAFKYVLKCKSTKYYIKYIIYLIVTVIMYTATYLAVRYIAGATYGMPGLGMFILKAVIAVIVSNIILIVLMFRTKEFKYTKDLAKKYAKSALNKFTNKLT